MARCWGDLSRRCAPDLRIGQLATQEPFLPCQSTIHQVSLSRQRHTWQRDTYKSSQPSASWQPRSLAAVIGLAPAQCVTTPVAFYSYFYEGGPLVGYGTASQVLPIHRVPWHSPWLRCEKYQGTQHPRPACIQPRGDPRTVCPTITSMRTRVSTAPHRRGSGRTQSSSGRL